VEPSAGTRRWLPASIVLGPDSSLAPLIAAAILPLAAGSDAQAVALAGMLAILADLLSKRPGPWPRGSGLSVVGPLPKGLPSFAVPSVPAGQLRALVAGAVGIALVSFADTSVLSRTFAIRGGYRVDPCSSPTPRCSPTASGRRSRRRRRRCGGWSCYERFGDDRFHYTVGAAVSAYVDATGVQWTDWEDRAAPTRPGPG
jgi:hypothetical protein